MAAPESGVRLARAWRLGLLVLCACTLRPPAALVEPHLAAVAPADVPADRPVLGVGRFLDRRPSHERSEQRPPLEMHWWGFSRVGPEQSGDVSFASAVAEGARRDAGSTLVRSGAFSSVVWVDSDAEHAPERAARGDVDWVLTAEIEELRGVRHRDFALNVARIGWIRRRDGQPTGRATLLYRVYDASGEVLHVRVAREHTSAGSTPAGAALDALAAANEQAAAEIYRAVVSSSGLRRVPLRVLDACGLGQPRARALVDEASGVFEREIAVRLVAERQAWVPSQPGLSTGSSLPTAVCSSRCCRWRLLQATRDAAWRSRSGAEQCSAAGRAARWEPSRSRTRSATCSGRCTSPIARRSCFRAPSSRRASSIR
jgi:hypothetical protein